MGLGGLVLVGWLAQLPALIQVAPGFVPMQFNTALGFLLSGLGLTALLLGGRGVAMICGLTVGLLGVLTLVEYVAGIDIGLDELFMDHYIQVQTSHPGRMAPNTALCFTLMGLALGLMAETKADQGGKTSAAILAALTAALGFVALFGYVTGVEAAYGWGHLTRMAIHTAIGFLFLGAGMLGLSWAESSSDRRQRFPDWVPQVLAIWVLAITVALWQAMVQSSIRGEDDLASAIVHHLTLGFGLVLAAALGWALYLVQINLDKTRRLTEAYITLARQEVELRNLNRDLESRIALRTAELERSQADLLASQQAGRVGTWRWDIKARTVEGSGECLRIFAMDGQEDSFALTRLLKQIVRKDKKRVTKSFADAASAGAPIHLEYTIVTPDGLKRDVDVRGEPVMSEDGTPLRFQGVVQDITERVRDHRHLQESEERLSLLLNSTQEGIYTLDRAGICTLCNPAAARLLGFDSPGDLVGQDMHALTHHTKADGRPYPAKDCAVCRAYRMDDAVHRSDELFWRADGTFFRVEYDAHPMRRDGRLIGAVVVFADITDRVEAEKNLRQAQKMESLGNLAGGIAHDFNNMLLPILALSELTRKQLPEGSRERKRLEIVVDAAKRASHLVKTILTFSRRSETEPKVERVDLYELIGQSLNLLRATLPSTVDIQAKLDPNTGFIMADSTQISTVVIDVASNAVDAMEGRVGRLSIGLSALPKGDKELARLPNLAPGAYARLTVTDSGKGMNEATMERIFDPFFTTKPVGEGTGLGLSMVHGIVTHHGGAIKVESAPNKGATFKFYFPLL
ncbi:hypothetical protein JCM17960_05100 [Magnetospira thiophila]